MTGTTGRRRQRVGSGARTRREPRSRRHACHAARTAGRSSGWTASLVPHCFSSASVRPKYAEHLLVDQLHVASVRHDGDQTWNRVQDDAQLSLARSSAPARFRSIPIEHTRGRGSRILANARDDSRTPRGRTPFMAGGLRAGTAVAVRPVATATAGARRFVCQRQTRQRASRTWSWYTADSSTDRAGRGSTRILKKRRLQRHDRSEPDRLARRRRGGHQAHARRSERPGDPRRPFLRRRGDHRGRDRAQRRGPGVHRRVRAGRGRVRLVADQGSAPRRPGPADPAAAGRLPVPGQRKVRRLVRRGRRAGGGRASWPTHRFPGVSRR